MTLRTTPALALAVLMLAGCSSVHLPGPIDRNCACQSDKPIEVKIGADGRPAPERPIILVPRNSTNPIVWRLDPAGGLRFAGDGIRIEGRILDRVVNADNERAVVLQQRPPAFADACRISEDRLQVSCPYKSVGPAAYKYLITVQVGNQDPITVDPLIVEM